jgi:hypothetical protein
VFRRKKTDWEQRGKQATVLVIEAAKELSEAIEKEEEKPLSNLSANNLFLFNAALFIICLDVTAFQYLEEKERGVFIDAIYEGVTAAYAKAMGLPRDEWMGLGQRLNKYADQLGKFGKQLFPEKDQSPKGTLFWEYSKVLPGQFEVSYGGAIASSLYSMQLGVSLLTETSKWFKKKQL